MDVTNLFTLGVGRPLHVFDVKKVSGDTLTWRMAREGEELAALSGKTYALTPEDGVIADRRGVESLGGIVGGAHTGCDEATEECFIECALFDPVRIARSGRRHDIRTDARQRFERGVDQHALRLFLDMATATMIELCGGEASEVSEAGAEPAWRREATLRFSALANLGGLAVPPDEACARLERLGFETRARDAERVTVAVPPWRNDVAAPILLDQWPGLDAERARRAAAGCAAVEAEADLVEEVLRLGGLDAVPPVSMPRAHPVPAPSLSPAQSRTALARRVLAARGFREAVTYGFLEKRIAALFGETPEAMTLLNPIAADLDQMRPTPVASLAAAAARNIAQGLPDVTLGEIGAGYREGGQAHVAAGIRAGRTPANWATPARGFDLFDAKGDALAVLEALGVPAAAMQVTQGDATRFYHPGRSGTLRQGPKLVLAHFGELHPRVLLALDLPGAAAAFEVFLDAVPESKRRKRGQPDIPALQPVRRDFAFLVDAAQPADALLRAARGAEKALIAEVGLFDRYAGERVPDGMVSLAIEVVLQPRERTLTDAEIEAVSAKIVAAVAKATGATLRG